MKRYMLIVLVLLSTLLSAGSVYAQGCSMCAKTASSLDDKSAKGLNGGILYLAAIPLTLIGTIGFIWWRHNKNN